jgi:hypothetical protein
VDSEYTKAYAVEVNPFHRSKLSIFDMDTYAMVTHRNMCFDTDSYPIKIENCCTQSITSYKTNFVPNTIRAVHDKQVRGFGDHTTKITHQSTVRWSILDNSGQQHDIIIPNTYYVLKCNIRILSPQHWAQEMQDHTPLPDGTQCITYHTRVVLKWQQQSRVKTLHIDPGSNNVAT